MVILLEDEARRAKLFRCPSRLFLTSDSFLFPQQLKKARKASMDNKKQTLGAFAVGIGLGAVAAFLFRSKGKTFSLADQPKRYAEQKRSRNVRALVIKSVFDPSKLAGKRVLVTGGTRGLGLALVKELQKCKVTAAGI
jgi:hypothetical protein